MSRRLLLGLAAVALLAGLSGCSAAGSLSMEPVTDTELAERASVELPSAEETAGTDRSVARRAVENGTARAVAPGPPVATEDMYREDGRFYRLTATVVGSETGEAVEYTIDANVTETDADREGWSVVAFEDLPTVDRRLLGALLESGRLPESDRERIGIGEVYRDEELNESRLASGEVDAVRFDGSLYRVTVRERESRELQVYRYEATTVAESAVAYGRQLREEYAFELSGLSEAERSVVQEAIDGSYYAEDDSDEGFAALVERFRSQEAVRERTYGGEYVVRYEGQLYWVEMDDSGFDD